MLKKFAVCAAVMASLYTASALAAPTLRVGSETTFPPFEFVDVKTKQFVGYEIDLINAVGKKAGYNISVQSMGFDAIIPALMTGTVDVTSIVRQGDKMEIPWGIVEMDRPIGDPLEAVRVSLENLRREIR